LLTAVNVLTLYSGAAIRKTQAWAAHAWLWITSQATIVRRRANTVRPGDTMVRIRRRHGLTMQELVSVGNNSDRFGILDRIVPGQIVELPAKEPSQ
jgi:hypothetical protein